MAERKLFEKQLPSRRVKIVCFYHIEHVYLAYTYTLACHVLIETVEFFFYTSVIYSDFTFYICYILSFFFFKWKQPMGIVKNIQLILYIIIFNNIMLYYITLCNNKICAPMFFPFSLYLFIYGFILQKQPVGAIQIIYIYGCPLKIGRVEPGQYLDGRPPVITRMLLKEVLVSPAVGAHPVVCVGPNAPV